MSPQLLAYLDPGTGSVILQALVGGVAGIVVIVKMGGRKFLSFLPIIGKKYRSASFDENAADSSDYPEDRVADGASATSGESAETDLAALLEDAADS